MEIKGPYKACYTSKHDVPYLYGIEGPGDGLGYYAWQLYPENTFETWEDAERVARMMNLAFREGQRRQQRDTKAVLGIS